MSLPRITLHVLSAIVIVAASFLVGVTWKIAPLSGVPMFPEPAYLMFTMALTLVLWNTVTTHPNWARVYFIIGMFTMDAGQYLTAQAAPFSFGLIAYILLRLLIMLGLIPTNSQSTT